MWSTKIHQSGYSFALVSNFKLSIISEASSKLGETNVHVPNPAPGRPVLVGKTSLQFLHLLSQWTSNHTVGTADGPEKGTNEHAGMYWH